MQALFAAVLFGANAPFAKILLGEIDPVLLAALLYLGSGFGLLGLRFLGISALREAPLARADWPWLAGAIAAGGVVAPILLMYSLRHTPASLASLLLNFESVATAIIAVYAFKEAINRRTVFALSCITVASVILSWNSSGSWGFSLGALGVLAACIMWGIDNNFTRNISGKDPFSIVTVKGLAAGFFSLLLALLLGNSLPSWNLVLLAMLLGSVTYGGSIVLFVNALRGLGAARTSALFGTAPLAGMLLSFLILGESMTLMFIAALPLMLLGTIMLLYERHSHIHVHKETIHEHKHCHDDAHHEHSHGASLAPDEIHSHLHAHPAIEHEHAHAPDTHHRHSH